MHNVLLEFYFLNIDYQQKLNEYAAAADVGQREYNIYKGKKNTLGLVDIHVQVKTN
jgi:hypothetical protein